MGLLPGNRYRYIDSLIALEASSPLVLGRDPQLALPLPLRDPYLRSYPDQRLAAYFRQGIQFGFRVGFNTTQPLESCVTNHPSVLSNPDAVGAYLQDEVSSHRLIQVPTADWDLVHASPIGIIPKSNQPGKYRLIHNLSYPKGCSMNDGILKELCSLRYSSIDDAVSLAKELRRGALLTKLDLQSAYRRILVHTCDHTVKIWLLW